MYISQALSHTVMLSSLWLQLTWFQYNNIIMMCAIFAHALCSENKHVMYTLHFWENCLYCVYKNMAWTGTESSFAFHSLINSVCKAKSSNGIDYYNYYKLSVSAINSYQNTSD